MEPWIKLSAGVPAIRAGRALAAAFALMTATLYADRAAFAQAQDAAAPAQKSTTGAHAIAMHGAPALSEDFSHFPYVRPDAPAGGRLTLGMTGGFDSLNPFILRGRASRAVRDLVVESLMARSWDEPFTLYGLLAERVELPDDRAWVVFHLHPKASFSNGDPVTPEDVIWTMETLRDKGRPNHRAFYSQISSATKVGERGVRFEFVKPEGAREPNRELPLLMGLMPVLSKADWEGREFETGDLRAILGSGPYQVAEADAGRRILFRKNPEYWAADLPVNRGRHNFAEIEHLYFRNGAALFEAFTAGEIDLYAESDPAHWSDAYDVPALREGRIQRAEIPHGRPSGMDGFVFNTRRPIFEDRRVRQALALALDYAWINERFYRGGYARITSYYSGSALGFDDAPSRTERALLSPFLKLLPPDTLETGWRPPAGAGDGRNRRNMRAARKLLSEAGWTLSDGVLKNAAGEPFQFELLLSVAQDDRVAQIFAKSLKSLGITADVRQIDSAQHQDRLLRYDYDMILRRWGLSLSPGEEQRFYWSAKAGAAPGSRNYMGVANPAVDTMINAMMAARRREDFTNSVRALDRVLSSGVYVIPLGYLDRDLVAWSSSLGRPEATPLYGYGYALDAWWRKPE